MSNFEEDFVNPPNTYRSMPLWVWNGDMSEGRITEMLEQYVRQGMGGVFVHPRPGLITEYLSERWFELWGYALSECKRLGLKCNVYDENSYPSGFAGGHVSAQLPHGTGQHIYASFYKHSPVRYQGELIACYRLEKGQAFRLEPHADLNRIMDEADAVNQSTHMENRHQIPDIESGIAFETRILVLERRRHSGTPWTAWLPYVDLTRLDVAREFLATTHERYFQYFGDDFGETIQAFFIDEPHLGLAEHTGDISCLPFSRHILRAFRKDHGYELTEHLADLFVEQKESTITRFDYYYTIQQLWSKNFLKVVHDWCEQHKVHFTGHFLEHDWPYPHTNPNCMEANRWLHMPGIDLLACQFNYQQPEANHLLLLTVRELNSLANQLERKRRFCEAHGVAGYDVPFYKLKQLSDWLIVNGVNFINEHLSFQTIHGNRKYDHPVSFSDHSPWWPYYRYLNDHVARMCAAMSHGTQQNRLLLLQPTTTGWTRANPTQPFAYSFVDAHRVNTPNVRLRMSQAGLISQLAAHQIDFDLGDEFYLRDYGRVVGKKLQVGACTYQAVIVPEIMDNWCDSTLKIVEKLLESGGVVMCIGTAPHLVNGRPDRRPSKLHRRFPTRWWVYESFKDMLLAIDEHFPAYIRKVSGEHLPPQVALQSRFFKDGRILHLLVNTGHDPVAMEVVLVGNSLCALDTFTGCKKPVLYRKSGKQMTAKLLLQGIGHALWEVNTDNVEDEPDLNPTEEISIDKCKVSVNAPNVLALDFCDLTVDNNSHHGLPVTHANRLCWQLHGFDADIWTGAVQFKSNNKKLVIDEKSGFTVSYSFEIAPNAFVELKKTGNLKLAIENPHLYQIRINRTPVDIQAGEKWLDETIRAIPISEVIRPGTNIITLEAAPFNIHHEIERVYIIGDFCLIPSSPGFRITQSKSVYIGDWTIQGYPMYSGSMTYIASFELKEACKGLRIQIPKWIGAVSLVTLDEYPPGYIAFPPYTFETCQELGEGRHKLEIEVVGTPKNLLGPHHAPGVVPGPGAWNIAPKTPPDGNEYERLPQGLLGPIKVYPLK